MKQFLKDKSFKNDLASTSIPFQLGLLQKAVNYQKWILESVWPFLGKRILEVGAGIGNMSRWFPVREKLIFSEIDPSLFTYLQSTTKKYFKENDKVKALHVDLQKNWKELLEKENVDTIVSFNVMEHVEDDRQFFADLISILKKSKTVLPKRLITFVPAHQFLYGSVDKNYGHFRRYHYSDLKKMKNDIAPEADFFCRYLNLIGLPGWFILGRVLKNKEIGEKSILSFEKLCPWIKSFDDFLHLKLKIPFGQSIVSIVTLK